MTLSLRIPDGAAFEDIVFSHGWCRLAPFRWDDATRELSWLAAISTGSEESAGPPARFRVRAPAAPDEMEVDVETTSPLGAPTQAAALASVRSVLRMDEDLSGFHQMAAMEPGLKAAAARRQGRMLRAPTVFEDAVKTLCTVNITWRQTKTMVEGLVERLGAPGAGGLRAFPTPQSLVAAGPEWLRQEGRLGYRAPFVHGLARAVSEQTLDLEALRQPVVDAGAAAARVRAIPGFGPYATANLLMLLGHYGHLPLDSWVRRTVREAWYPDCNVTDAEIQAAFARFGKWKALAYRWHDWKGALHEEAWRPASAPAKP